ncbi:hypothetical protein YTPLAS73_05400 [Nitrosarchaeum sp.]|nr:hypothetical protein YTPLAS73_05400 [Nitrosarchaeum sp.]
MYDSLVKSIQALQNSKYGKGNKKRLTSIHSALKQASSLFTLDNQSNEKTDTIISFRNIDQAKQIPKILEEFVNDFEHQCLKRNGASAKNYSIFSVTLLKIIKTLDADKTRGLLSAHAINILNKMFAKYPVEYNKRAIRDPLGLLFVITELAIDAERNLSRPYEFDESIPLQITPLMQRYHKEFDNALLQIISEFNKMPKFRLAVSIGERHKEIIKNFLQYAIIQLPLESKIDRAKNILEKIIDEKNDSIALEHYNMLKICYADKDLCPHLAQIAKKANKTERRFVNTILDEISNL